MKHQNTIIKNIHLVISVIVVVPTSVIYGFNLSFPIDIQPESIDEYNFNKAIMGLYLLFALLWTLGIFKKTYWFPASISNTVFMFGLALGRLLSIFIDGEPSKSYTVGTLGELILGVYGLWVLNRFKKA